MATAQEDFREQFDAASRAIQAAENSPAAGNPAIRDLIDASLSLLLAVGLLADVIDGAIPWSNEDLADAGETEPDDSRTAGQESDQAPAEQPPPA